MSIKDIISPLLNWVQAVKKPHTIQYPLEEREGSERYRGFHYNKQDICIGCGTCSDICMNKAIDMVQLEENPKNGDSGFRPKIDYGRCCWCGYCVEICPSGSLSMTNEYSWVTDNPDEYRYIPGKDKKWFDLNEKGFKQSEDYVLLHRDRIPISMTEPEERIKTFAEVVLGYTEEEAVKEAERCINCGLCTTACPAHMHIPDYIEAIRNKEYEKAVKLMYDNNPLAEACGKFCTRRCEEVCAVSRQGEPIAIRWLKRFATERFDDLKEIIKIERKENTNKKIAVIGAGPAGLTAAFYLAQRGHNVEIFEALSGPGGMINAGIPKYRLPIESIDKQVELIKSAGVKIHYNHQVTKDEFTRLRKDYDVLFLACGLHDSMELRISGENEAGVLSAVSFLRHINFGQKVEVGKRVVVVGGGNVAIDAARVSKRLGADVTISYRRRQQDMPADWEEIEDAEAENIDIQAQTIPLRVEKSGKKLKYIYGKAEMHDQGPGKRPKPVLIDGEEYVIEADSVIAAIGQRPDYSFIPDEVFEHLNEKWNKIPVDENGMTAIEGIFAGGDITNNTKDAISAIADGLRAVRGIDEYLKSHD